MTQKILSSNYMFKRKRIAVIADNVPLSNGNKSIWEIGKISDIESIASLTKDKKLLFVK